MLPSSSEGERHYTMVVLDTQGFQRAAAAPFILDRSITDEFIQAMVVDLSDIVIYVVNTLRIADQLKIRFLQKEMASKDTENKKKLFILHNFMHLFETTDVQEYIKTDIIDAFGGKEIQNPEGELWYQSKMISKFPVVHFIMANAFSEAGVYYNAKTIRLIQKFIGTYPTTSRKINMTEAVMEHLHNVLPSYFYPTSLKSRAEALGANQTFIEVVQYSQNVITRFYKQATHTVQSTKSKVSSWLFGSLSKESKKQTPHDYFEIAYVPSEELNSSKGYIRLVEPRKLQYLPMDSISGRPDYFPKISVDELISNDIWKLYIDAPGSEDIQWSVQFFENDLPLFTIQARRELPQDYSQKSSAFRKARDVLHIDRFTDSFILHNVLNAREMAYTIKTQERQFGRWVRHVQISSAVMTDTIKTEYIDGVIIVQGKLRTTSANSRSTDL
ncbi:unnamed protein product [Didymodactylos carnosus]|uniref:Uncharacterized protein n=1 Tax=Didymodactylos carnosus TaxID=1234261 RepID=A0A815ZHR6_9BILA|nr:unnamed protein product [Didymodactylos carnosus]CAF4453896.1 unnamed protein product [Didymodactylos carnosus]